MMIRQRIALLLLTMGSLLDVACSCASDTDLVPVSPAWQIDELADWMSTSSLWLDDRRSHVPLQKRQTPPGPKNMVFHSQITSGQKTQGLDHSHLSVFRHWNLTDILVYWAGSKRRGHCCSSTGVFD